jgi:tetratricopeptide (TPR) repeat protein
MANQSHQIRSNVYFQNSLLCLLSTFCLSACSHNTASITSPRKSTTVNPTQPSAESGPPQPLSVDDPRVSSSLGMLGSLFTIGSHYTDQLTGLLVKLEKSNQNASGNFDPDSLIVATNNNKSTVNSEVVTQSLAMGLCNFASLYSAQGKYTEALPLYERALSILEKAFGKTHVALLTVLDGYATALEKTGQPAKSAQLMARAASIRSENAKKNGIRLSN